MVSVVGQHTATHCSITRNIHQLLFLSNHYRGTTRTVTMTIRPIESAVKKNRPQYFIFAIMNVKPREVHLGN